MLHAMFQHRYAGKKHKGPLEQIQGINPSSIPPCQSVLQKKLLQTNYTDLVWKRVGLFKPCKLKAEEHGWLLTNDRYAINWFDCVQLPQDIVNILGDNVHESNVESDNSWEETPSYSSDESEFEEHIFD